MGAGHRCIPNRVDALVHGATDLMRGLGGPSQISSPILFSRAANQEVTRCAVQELNQFRNL